ncbi:PHD finger protein 20 [Pleurostoma richardsiae]|uniref:PHD finger protein 20 n=1 Tax=Pleurostoma richardsiae TaxID=41990 RepID=A0AA38VF01_9PEZI|nr:PHD finger protein 20 [Pleurostoma richardsiae]
MSGDQEAPSFGEPNAQPPTPKQTPTSAVFPSPVFETPRNNQSRCDESSGWTPRFAEEYSVFNSTPGNLRGSQGPFADFVPSTPYQQSTGHKRQLSAGGIAAEIATHVNHFSPNPNDPLPPVDPSRRLASTPGELGLIREETEEDGEPHPRERSAKKPRRSTAVREIHGQTATPPPSSKKGRKLAPKLDNSNMQHDQGFGHHDFTGTPQQPNLGVFVTTPSDVFGYPMSAPATAPAYTNARTFWDPEVDANMMGIDMDFSAVGNDVFQTPTPAHRAMGSHDWGRANSMFHETGNMPEQNQEHQQPAKRGSQTAPKTAMAPVDTSTGDQQMYANTYPTPIDDPFGIVGPGEGVDPGLLFSRPGTANMDTAPLSVSQPPSSSAPAAPLAAGTAAQQVPFKAPPRGQLRRSASVREVGSSKQLDRASMISPVKPSLRPGLSRSFSENRGKRPLARSSLPALAPAPKPVVHQAGNPGIGTSRPGSQGSRVNGRTSPLKNHQRLSSLSSIPEAATPRNRTSVKFTIDENGRARAETTVTVDDEPRPPPSSARRRQSARPLHKTQWDSDDEDASSTDDEPIIIPSRNSSFAFPDSRFQSSMQTSFQAPQRSFSERGADMYAGLQDESLMNDPESEAETVMNDIPQGAGDAASELRKVMQNRQRGGKPNMKPRSGASTGRRQRFVSAPGSVSGSSYRGNSAISPTASLPTPSTDTRGQGLRCVCNRAEQDRDGDGFMVQCESCEFWLHGKCINITKRSMPTVYICAFCANTPNMRGGRMRDTGRATMAPPSSAASPLAHKSFRSFR